MFNSNSNLCKNFDDCINNQDYDTALYFLKINNLNVTQYYINSLLTNVINLIRKDYESKKNSIKKLISFILSKIESIDSNTFFRKIDIKNCSTNTEGWITLRLLSFFTKNKNFTSFYVNNLPNKTNLKIQINYFNNNKNKVGCVQYYNSILNTLVKFENKIEQQLIPGQTGPPDTWPHNSHKSSKLSTLAIIGIITGSILFIILLVIFIKTLKNKKKKSKRKKNRMNSNNLNNRLNRL